jgi:hypothetical protein
MLSEDEIHAREIDSETRLWRLVIFQALQDALGVQSTAAKNKHAKARAIEWFRSGNRDFRQVCDLAGLDSSAVQAAALEGINR